jgi:hypothetical protein
MMPLWREWSDRTTEVIINIPESSVRTKEPDRSNRSHQGDAAVLRGLVVNVATADWLSGRDDCLDSFHDVCGKHHGLPNVPAFSCGRQSEPQASDKPVCCNAMLGGFGMSSLGVTADSFYSTSKKPIDALVGLGKLVQALGAARASASCQHTSVLHGHATRAA